MLAEPSLNKFWTAFVLVTPDDLLRRLLPILSTDPIGKPWVPSNPLPIFEPAHNQLQAIYPALRGRNLKETQTKNKLWLEMLRTASMGTGK